MLSLSCCEQHLFKSSLHADLAADSYDQCRQKKLTFYLSSDEK